MKLRPSHAVLAAAAMTLLSLAACKKPEAPADNTATAPAAVNTPAMTNAPEMSNAPANAPDTAAGGSQTGDGLHKQ